MKTIEIQKDTNLKSNVFVIVNGKKHLMRHPSLKVQVPDDKPFELRVKQSWDGSPVYTFEPKDNMVLQILRNRRLTLFIAFLSPVAMFLAFVVYFLNPNKLTSIIFAVCILLFPMIFYLIRRKKIFTVKFVDNLQ